MDTIPITATWTPPFKPRRHEQHQDMLRSHVAAKQARKELHQRTGGRKFVYPGFL